MRARHVINADRTGYYGSFTFAYMAEVGHQKCAQHSPDYFVSASYDRQ